MDFTHGGNVYKVAREKKIPIENIIDFSANINPLGLSVVGNERLKSTWSGLLNYPDPEYIALKKALGNFHQCDPINIYLGNGAIDLIFFLMRSLKPNRAMILAPTFVEYERALMAVGSEVIPFYLKEEDDYQVRIEKLLDKLKTIDCLVLCNPNNPTGQMINQQDMKRVIDYCAQNDIRLILDEAFMDFTDMDESASCIPLLKTYNGLFILRSITKFFAVPGLRLGYVLTINNDFSAYYERNKEPWCVNHFAQEYTIAALSDTDYISESKEYIMKERVWLFNALNDMANLTPYKSYGNYIFFKYNGVHNIKEKLENEGILIRSCINYRGLTNEYFRVAVKSREHNKTLIEIIKGFEYE